MVHNYHKVDIDRKAHTYTVDPNAGKKSGPFFARATLTKIDEILFTRAEGKSLFFKMNKHGRKTPLSESKIIILQSHAQSVRFLYSESRKNAPMLKKIELFFEALFCKIFNMKTDDEVVNDLADKILNYRHIVALEKTPETPKGPGRSTPHSKDSIH